MIQHSPTGTSVNSTTQLRSEPPGSSLVPTGSSFERKVIVYTSISDSNEPCHPGACRLPLHGKSDFDLQVHRPLGSLSLQPSLLQCAGLVI
jgi:hypothetical protein